MSYEKAKLRLDHDRSDCSNSSNVSRKHSDVKCDIEDIGVLDIDYNLIRDNIIQYYSKNVGLIRENLVGFLNFIGFTSIINSEEDISNLYNFLIQISQTESHSATLGITPFEINDVIDLQTCLEAFDILFEGGNNSDYRQSSLNLRAKHADNCMTSSTSLLDVRSKLMNSNIIVIDDPDFKQVNEKYSIITNEVLSNIKILLELIFSKDFEYPTLLSHDSDYSLKSSSEKVYTLSDIAVILNSHPYIKLTCFEFKYVFSSLFGDNDSSDCELTGERSNMILHAINQEIEGEIESDNNNTNYMKSGFARSNHPTQLKLQKKSTNDNLISIIEDLEDQIEKISVEEEKCQSDQLLVTDSVNLIVFTLKEQLQSDYTKLINGSFSEFEDKNQILDSIESSLNLLISKAEDTQHFVNVMINRNRYKKAFVSGFDDKLNILAKEVKNLMIILSAHDYNTDTVTAIESQNSNSMKRVDEIMNLHQDISSLLTENNQIKENMRILYSLNEKYKSEVNIKSGIISDLRFTKDDLSKKLNEQCNVNSILTQEKQKLESELASLKEVFFNLSQESNLDRARERCQTEKKQIRRVLTSTTGLLSFKSNKGSNDLPLKCNNALTNDLIIPGHFESKHQYSRLDDIEDSNRTKIHSKFNSYFKEPNQTNLEAKLNMLKSELLSKIEEAENLKKLNETLIQDKQSCLKDLHLLQIEKQNTEIKLVRVSNDLEMMSHSSGSKALNEISFSPKLVNKESNSIHFAKKNTSFSIIDLVCESQNINRRNTTTNVREDHLRLNQIQANEMITIRSTIFKPRKNLMTVVTEISLFISNSDYGKDMLNKKRKKFSINSRISEKQYQSDIKKPAQQPDFVRNINKNTYNISLNTFYESLPRHMKSANFQVQSLNLLKSVNLDKHESCENNELTGNLNAAIPINEATTQQSNKQGGLQLKEGGKSTLSRLHKHLSYNCSNEKFVEKIKNRIKTKKTAKAITDLTRLDTENTLQETQNRTLISGNPNSAQHIVIRDYMNTTNEILTPKIIKTPVKLTEADQFVPQKDFDFLKLGKQRFIIHFLQACNEPSDTIYSSDAIIHLSENEMPLVKVLITFQSIYILNHSDNYVASKYSISSIIQISLCTTRPNLMVVHFKSNENDLVLEDLHRSCFVEYLQNVCCRDRIVLKRSYSFFDLGLKELKNAKNKIGNKIRLAMVSTLKVKTNGSIQQLVMKDKSSLFIAPNFENAQKFGFAQLKKEGFLGRVYYEERFLCLCDIGLLIFETCSSDSATLVSLNSAKVTSLQVEGKLPLSNQSHMQTMISRNSDIIRASEPNFKEVLFIESSTLKIVTYSGSEYIFKLPHHHEAESWLFEIKKNILVQDKRCIFNTDEIPN